VLALDDAALFLLAGIATVTLLMMALFYRPLLLECLDPGFLRSVSRTSAAAHYVFLVLAVLNLVGGFHALGTLMAVGMMILPAAAARFWARGVSGLMVAALLIAIASSVGGLLLSYHGNLPSGPAIILTAGGIYLLSLTFGREGSLFARHLSIRLHRTEGANS